MTPTDSIISIPVLKSFDCHACKGKGCTACKYTGGRISEWDYNKAEHIWWLDSDTGVRLFAIDRIGRLWRKHRVVFSTGDCWGLFSISTSTALDGSKIHRFSVRVAHNGQEYISDPGELLLHVGSGDAWWSAEGSLAEVKGGVK